MLDGHSLGYEYNHMLGVSAPKGSEEGDESGAIRTAGNTRPLGLKNADNKIITAACCYSLDRVAPKCLDEIQRGFVARRILEITSST
eukprot:9152549-Pyramimonas_sp.AAC.1